MTILVKRRKTKQSSQAKWRKISWRRRTNKRIREPKQQQQQQHKEWMKQYMEIWTAAEQIHNTTEDWKWHFGRAEGKMNAPLLIQREQNKFKKVKKKKQRNYSEQTILLSYNHVLVLASTLLILLLLLRLILLLCLIWFHLTFFSFFFLGMRHLPFHIGNVVSLNDTRAIYVVCDTLNYVVSNLKRYQEHTQEVFVWVCGEGKKKKRRKEIEHWIDVGKRQKQPTYTIHI